MRTPWPTPAPHTKRASISRIILIAAAGAAALASDRSLRPSPSTVTLHLAVCRVAVDGFRAFGTSRTVGLLRRGGLVADGRFGQLCARRLAGELDDLVVPAPENPEQTAGIAQLRRRHPDLPFVKRLGIRVPADHTCVCATARTDLIWKQRPRLALDLLGRVALAPLFRELTPAHDVRVL